MLVYFVLKELAEVPENNIGWSLRLIGYTLVAHPPLGR
jgi:hypothetical protein